jgi:P2-related tail formation protein
MPVLSRAITISFPMCWLISILDLFEKNRITVDGAKTVLLQLLTAIYEDELIEEPHRRETVIENIERQKEQILINILGVR